MLAGYAVTVIGTLRVSIYYLSMISWGQSSQKLDLPRPEKYYISASVLLRPATQIIILSWPCTVCKWFMNGNYTDLLFCMNIHSLCLYTQKNGDGLSLSKLIAAVLTKKNVFLKSVEMTVVIKKIKYVIWYTETPELLVTAHLNVYCIQSKKSPVKLIHFLGPLVQTPLFSGEIFWRYP